MITLDLSPLANTLKSVGWNFLSDCTALTSIDLSPLNNVKKLGLSFLTGCPNLDAVVTFDLHNEMDPPLSGSLMKAVKDAMAEQERKSE